MMSPPPQLPLSTIRHSVPSPQGGSVCQLSHVGVFGLCDSLRLQHIHLPVHQTLHPHRSAFADHGDVHLGGVQRVQASHPSSDVQHRQAERHMPERRGEEAGDF